LRVLEPHLLKKQNENLDLYKSISGTPKATNNVKELLAAAYEGRLATLFIQENSEIHGTFDESTAEATLYSEQQKEGQDLIEAVVSYTLKNNGNVYVLKQGEMPSETKVAGILRF
jgi:hypothetical protein